MTEIWKRVVCAICGGPFVDENDWENRHDDPDGEDIHDDCCEQCKEQE